MTSPSSPTRRHLQGVVVSTKMAKTAIIRIDRRVAHPTYGKFYVVSKKFKVHDENGQAHVGDLIEVEETRPVSKDKRWRYLKTITAVAAHA